LPVTSDRSPVKVDTWWGKREGGIMAMGEEKRNKIIFLFPFLPGRSMVPLFHFLCLLFFPLFPLASRSPHLPPPSLPVSPPLSLPLSRSRFWWLSRLIVLPPPLKLGLAPCSAARNSRLRLRGSWISLLFHKHGLEQHRAAQHRARERGQTRKTEQNCTACTSALKNDPTARHWRT
jgi:hypothetical protein